jgi:hypothetical protein
MTRTVDILFTTFSYGGNGGMKSEHPDVRDWLIQTIPKAHKDKRIDRVALKDFADTPITMTRNLAVATARKGDYDVLVMIDSDMSPDLLAGHPAAKPFFDSSFNYLYERMENGEHVAIGAPYGGPPPVENSYVFRWGTHQSDHPDDTDIKLDQFTREEAATHSGIEPVAALPTGLIMWDMKVFELTEPETKEDTPWFYYEYSDKYETEKHSTEDVTATRDISLMGTTKWGYSPIMVNWDAWAGHWKPKCVGKPSLMTPEAAGRQFEKASKRLSGNVSEEFKHVDFTGSFGNDGFSGREGLREVRGSEDAGRLPQGANRV